MSRWHIGGVELLVMAVLLWLSWQIGTRGLASVLAEQAPHAALGWDPGNAEALLRVNAHEPDLGRKRSRAIAALARRPADGRGYRQLGEVAQAQGLGVQAGELYETAVRLTPRDRLAQAWLSDRALRSGNNAESVQRVLRLTTMDPLLRRPLYDYLAELSRHAGLHDEVAVGLAGEPDWREEFIAHWVQYRPDWPGLDELLVSTVSMGARLSHGERAMWVRYLVEGARWHAAYLTWSAGLPAGRWQAGSAYNGDFQHALAGQFDWQLQSRPDASVGIVARAGTGSNSALRVAFHGLGESFVPVSQGLLLPSGDYVMQMEAQMEALRGGVRWQTVCLQDDAPLGTGAILSGTHAWQRVQYAFRVPPGCPVQRLELLAQGDAGPGRLQGVAWFDAVRLLTVAVGRVDPSAEDSKDAPRPPAAGSQ
jgi:hypothetical protein